MPPHGRWECRTPATPTRAATTTQPCRLPPTRCASSIGPCACPCSRASSPRRDHRGSSGRCRHGRPHHRSTGYARSATDPGTTNCAPKPSVTTARPCTPTLTLIRRMDSANLRGDEPLDDVAPALGCWCCAGQEEIAGADGVGYIDEFAV